MVLGKPCKMPCFGFARPQNRVKYVVLAVSKQKNVGKYTVLAFQSPQSLVKCMVFGVIRARKQCTLHSFCFHQATKLC